MKTSDQDRHSADRREAARLVMDMLHRSIMHHALWFTEVRHQIGPAKALELLDQVCQKIMATHLDRLAKTLGFDIREGIPAALLDMPEETLGRLQEAVAANWLATDGIWFQALEFSHGMNDAKRCNDSCWAQFSPFEAWSIKRLLELPERPGLEGLKKALEYRLYAQINTHAITDADAAGFTYQMTACRVQSARQRKGLNDYPCKSAGLVEYTYFAQAIDDRIQTRCIGCPPDAHPPEWFCAWRFTLA